MAQYETGIITKERVISACKKLFYEKGYNETTIADISELSSVNQGLIHYHFKTRKNNIKSTLGMIVYTDLIKKSYEEAGEYGADDAFLIYTLGVYLYWYKFFNDEGYRKFATIACKEVFIDNVVDFADIYFGSFNPIKAISSMTDIQVHELDIIACIGADAKLAEYIGENIQKYSFEYVTDYCFSLYANIFDFDRKVMHQKLAESKKVFEKIDVEKLQYTF